jgi:demethylmenaquinone methyltransferase/2-methoxy-6-polyprenyl-1,4-benzoquinol methylase
MSSLALMRWLEGSPERYDTGMRLLTFGRVAALHVAVANAAIDKPGARVLEIGCGSGSVTTLLVARGASVTAIDQSPDMLEQAKTRLGQAAVPQVEWLEQTASEIDGLPKDAYDAVVLCLCLSDMSADERDFVLRESAARLVAGGRLIAADEVCAPWGWRRTLQVLWRVPQAVLGWLLVGSLSQPISELAAELLEAGFAVRSERGFLLGSLALFVAERRA